MSKDKKTKEKSTKKALIILISALAICFLAGYIVGKIMGKVEKTQSFDAVVTACLLYTSPSPRDKRQSRMPSSA